MVHVQRHLQTCSLSPAQKHPPEGRVRTRIQSAFHSPHYVPLGKMEHRFQGPTSGVFVGRGESPAKMVNGSPQLPLLGPDHPRRAGQRGSFCRCWRNAVKKNVIEKHLHTKGCILSSLASAETQTDRQICTPDQVPAHRQTPPLRGPRTHN